MMKTIKNNSGFTLIELLVVIAILMILMSLILSGVFAVKRFARAAAVRTQMDQVETAWKAYYDDYRAFPNSPAITVMDAAALDILRGTDTVLNPRAIQYLDIDIEPGEDLVDFWGTIIHVVLDTDNNNRVTVPGEVIRRRVATWSYGPDGVWGSDKDDDIITWSR